MKTFLIFFLFIPIFAQAQENPLDIFRPLESYVWCAEGKWGDGSHFRQEITLEFSLEDKVVLVHSKGFTDSEQTTFGLRNHGVRQYDQKLNQIKFWEFDVFGSVTEGTVTTHEKDIIYAYDYGGTAVTEMWIYKDQETYDFIVGMYDGKEWTQKFLETEFKRCEVSK